MPRSKHASFHACHCESIPRVSVNAMLPLTSQLNDMFDRRVLTSKPLLSASQHEACKSIRTMSLCIFKINGLFSSLFPDDSSLCILQGKQQCVRHSPALGMTNVCLSSVVSEPQLWTECPDTASLWQQSQKTLYSWLKGTIMAEPVALLDRPLYIIQDHCCFKCH